MTTFNIVHTADLHLGSLFSSTPEVAAERKGEQLDTLKQIMDICVSRNADALLIAGDMFDSMKVERRLLDDVKEMLSHYDIRIFITPGNHDPATPDSCYSEEWPENVHIFRGGMEKVEIPEKNTCVWGAGFTKTSCDETLLKDFMPVSSRINVLVLHGELTSSEFSDSRYNPIFEDALKNCGADYVALGHIHGYEHYECNDFLYCYPGAPAGRGFDETGEKGVLCGYAAKGFAHMDFYPLDSRQYFTEKLDVSGCASTQQFAGRIITVLRDRHGEKFSKHLYDLTLIGALENGITPSLPDITKRLRETLFYARLTDMTTTSLNLELLMNDGTLKGAFVRKMVNKMQNDSRNRDKYMRALLYGLRAFEGDVTINEDY
ncbi:MAG: DNA repair exonuclease [Firmicutes bacterium]|nr:DNA repair exonuclease [Bacillota bacterium]